MEKLRYKIRRLYIQNVKRVKIVEVIPKGNVIEIAGENSQGKSSILDSIKYVLGGKGEIPLEPIRRGEKSAKIILESDDFTATLTWTDNNKSYLEVAANTGKSPQKFLDEKISRIAFDPVEFERMKPKEQEVLLRKALNLDTSDLETERARLYELRKTVGYEVERLKVFRNELGQPIYDLPEKEESSQTLLDKINNISETNEKRNKLISKIASIKNDIFTSDERITIKMEQVRTLQKEADEIERIKIVNIQLMDSMKKELDTITIGNVTPLRGELMILEEKNRKIRQNQQINKIQNEYDNSQAEYNNCTEDIRSIDEQIQNKIKEKEFPIKGLSFNDNGIIFNDLPFGQTSQSERIKIGLAIAEALNSELQIVLIKDGSLLDKKSMKVIKDFAVVKDCQIWVERIEPTSSDAIIIEDGGVINA